VERLAAILCVFLLAAGQAYGGDGKKLILRTRVFDPLTLSPQRTSGLVQVVQANASARGILGELEERGCTVLGYLPEDAYIVRLPAEGALEGMAGIRWRGTFDPAWKRSPRLARMDPRSAGRLEVFAHLGRTLDNSRDDPLLFLFLLVFVRMPRGLPRGGMARRPDVALAKSGSWLRRVSHALIKMLCGLPRGASLASILWRCRQDS
jgi:hypothetical protein